MKNNQHPIYEQRLRENQEEEEQEEAEYEDEVDEEQQEDVVHEPEGDNESDRSMNSGEIELTIKSYAAFHAEGLKSNPKKSIFMLE